MRSAKLRLIVQALSLADGGDISGARRVAERVEEDLESLAATEAEDDGSAEASAAFAVVRRLRADVGNMASAFSSRDTYCGGGHAYCQMMSKSHAQQRSTLAALPPGVPKPPAAAVASAAQPSLATLPESVQTPPISESGPGQASTVPVPRTRASVFAGIANRFKRASSSRGARPAPQVRISRPLLAQPLLGATSLLMKMLTNLGYVVRHRVCCSIVWRGVRPCYQCTERSALLPLTKLATCFTCCCAPGVQSWTP